MSPPIPGHTGAMPELEPQMRPPEAIDGDGKFDQLPPARAVAVVEDEGVVLRPGRLAGSQADTILRRHKQYMRQ